MGGSQSSRKLTISNDDPANVIRVSDSVVQRFRGDKTEAVSSPPQQQQQAASVVPGSELASMSPVMPPRGPVAPSRAYPPAGIGLTSLQIRQEKEAELRANDAHWQRRINQLEETHQKINELMEREYSAAMSEMRDTLLEGKNTFGCLGQAPCSDGKRAVMECYKKNAYSPMLCAQQVQAFADCVDKHRTNMVSANRG